MFVTRRQILLAGMGTMLPPAFASAQGGDAAVAALQKIIDDTGVPGMAAAAFTRDRLALSAAAGLRSIGGKPATADDRWHIGSVTKPVTATLLARLVERHRVGWADAVYTLIPCRSVRPAYRDATLTDLLAHRAGLQENIGAPDFERFYADRRPLRVQRRAFACLALDQEPLAAGRGAFAYSNNGYVVAGAAAEAKTGESWEKLVRSQVLEPLGLRTAGFGPPSGGPLGHEAGRDGKPTPVPPTLRSDNPPAFGPAGRLHMSMPDLARFGYEHVRLARGLSNYLSTGSVRHLHSGAETYAMGWYRDTYRGGPLLLHTGSNTIWFAALMVAPASDVSVAVATNAGRALGGEKAVLTALGRIASLVLPRPA